ncbi:putative cyclin-B3-1 isoform X2 [Medicago truncatula]|uniref:putative cyclin-B3-1 isoform X2 n=1 Tax=Medicago truncatula TaxID=3880 RepID=UPI0019671E46|nr:putative cyclin-B3-1 isoform X2 [Medicago truncatula]
MVTLKVKSRLGSTRPSESRPTVGGGKNFKVFSENDRIQVGDGSTMTSVREVGAASRKSAIAANKGVISNATSNSKGDFKSMEKSSKTYGASGNMNARKALTDVTNAQGSSTTAAKRNISKIKVSAGSKTKTVGIPLRKSFTVREIRSPSHGGVQLDAPSGGLRVSLGDRKNSSSNGGQPVATKDRFARKPMLPTTTSTSRKSLPVTGLRASLGDQKNSSNGGQSVATKDRFARKPMLPTTTRKSLPVPRRVNRVEMNNTKENAGSSETANGQRGLPSKLTTGRRVSSQLTNARSNLWKTRVSDGFVQMVTSNAYQVSSRKSVKPVVKTTVKASTSQRTLKSKSISGQNKSKPTSTIASKDEEKVTSSLSDNSSVVFSNDANQRHQPSDGECSLKIDLSELIPENNLVVISDDTNQRHQPSDGESSLKTDLSELIPRKSSSRRKSYTTSLMEKSKILKENGEVREQDNLPSIDDECNHLEVSEYIDAIYQYYWVTEAHSQALSNYMSIQTEITPHMRGVLVNWLIEVHFKYDLMPETLYLTVTLLDQYLSQVHIKTSDMQLVGLTSLLLASKYEDFWHPRVKDLISISAESYTRDQMLGMEKLILRKLKFRLNAPTPYVFLIRFLKAAQSDMKLEHMAFFLIDLCLVEYEALAFKPSLLCASALYVARCTLQITPSWTPLLQKHARYEVSQIRDCADMILKFHKAAGKGKLTVAYEKYSRKELGGVAAVKPLDRLPR